MSDDVFRALVRSFGSGFFSCLLLCCEKERPIPIRGTCACASFLLFLGASFVIVSIVCQIRVKVLRDTSDARDLPEKNRETQLELIPAREAMKKK